MEAGKTDKLYMRIGEVCAMTELPASVLRFWETEFATLAPKKSSSGQRLYSQKDLDQVLEIKKLLYSEKLTIEGARKRLQGKKRPQVLHTASDPALTMVLKEVREELLNLRAMLS